MASIISDVADATSKFTAAVDRYFSALRLVYSSGGATPEPSTYTTLSNPLQRGRRYPRAKVFSVPQVADSGAGHPDFGPYVKRGRQKGKQGQTSEAQLPERSVAEVKPPDDDAWLTADSSQVSKYWQHYRLVLGTSTSDFVLPEPRASRANPTCWAGLAIDDAEREVRVAGRAVQLTPNEYDMLFELSVNAGRVPPHEHLRRRVWGPQNSGDAGLVRTIVKKLRRKLGDEAVKPTYIFTEARVGYRTAKP